MWSTPTLIAIHCVSIYVCIGWMCHTEGGKQSCCPGTPSGGNTTGLSKGVGFVRFDQRVEAERAIKHLHNSIPEGATEPITVKFANNPSNNAKALAPLAAYLSPQRRFAGPIHHPANRFRYIPLSPISRYAHGLWVKVNDDHQLAIGLSCSWCRKGVSLSCF